MAKKISRKRTTYSYRPPKRKGKRRKPLGSYAGKRRKRVTGKRRGGTWAKGKRARRVYSPVKRRISASARARSHRGVRWARLNPMAALKSMVTDGMMTFGGILGIRAVCHLLKVNVFDKQSAFSSGAMKTIAPVLPSAVAMLLAALSPKVIKGQPKLVAGLQAGATLVFFDSVLKAVLESVDTNNAIAPYLLPGTQTTVILPTTQAPAASGGWGMNEYVGSPMGLEVESAMALDEYVGSPMGGDYDVQEALAGNEGQAFETGYAGGSLAKTVFSNY
jgi:hypothetical protein